MKKALLTFTALSLSVALSACTHEDTYGNNADYTQQSDGYHKDWNHGDHMHMMAKQFFSEIDKNRDGVISRKEYNDYTREWFREADTNHDGQLTLAEVEAQLKREKGKMKAHHMHHDRMHNDYNENNGAMNYDNENSQYNNTQNRY